MLGARWRLVLHRREIGELVFGSVKLLGEVVHVTQNEFSTPDVDHVSCERNKFVMLSTRRPRQSTRERPVTYQS